MMEIDFARVGSVRRQVRWLLSVAIALVAFLSPDVRGAVQEGEGPFTGGGSFPFEGPAVLEPGSISFCYSTPGEPDFVFNAPGVEVVEYPGSLYLPETPFGPAGLLAGGGGTSPDYYLLFLNLGITIPMDANASGVQFVGAIGTGSMTVTATPIQGPNGTQWFIHRDANGRVCIYFLNPCLGATFKQFFTKHVTWKGTKDNPAGGPRLPEEGTWPGPDRGAGNGGAFVNTDGKHVYVDAPQGNGDYPSVLTTTSGTCMTDSPNIGDASQIEGDLENTVANGREVDEITVTWHFTLYVYCNGQITEKIQWSYTQTTTKPFGPTMPNGDFGGPTPGPANPPFINPGPVSTPATQLDPQHNQALNGDGTTGFAQGYINGAPAPGGW